MALNLGNTPAMPANVKAILDVALSAQYRGIDVHLIGIGDSWTAGQGARLCQEQGWFECFARDLKRMGGDRGRYLRWYLPPVVNSLSSLAGSDNDYANTYHLPLAATGWAYPNVQHGFSNIYGVVNSKPATMARSTFYTLYQPLAGGAAVRLPDTPNDHQYRPGGVYATSGPAAPAVGAVAGAVYLDGSCVWLDLGATAGAPAWTPNTSYGNVTVTIAGRNCQMAGNRASCKGVSAAAEPTIQTGTPMASTTDDGTVRWLYINNNVTGLTARANSAAYQFGDLVKNAAGTARLMCVGGKTGAVAPTMAKGDHAVTTDGPDAANFVQWTEWTYHPLRLTMPEGTGYELIAKRSTAAAGTDVVKAGFAQGLEDPVTIDLGGAAGADKWNTVFPIRSGLDLAARDLTVEWVSGVGNVEGVRVTSKPTKGGIYSYNGGHSGRSLLNYHNEIHANGRWAECFGRATPGFLPDEDYYLLVICLGINDYNGGVTSANASAYLAEMLSGAGTAFPEGRFAAIVVTPPPFTAGGAPSSNDAQTQWFAALGAAAVAAGAWWVQLSYAWGDLSASAATAEGFLVADSLHPSVLGHRLLADGLEQAMGIAPSGGASMARATLHLGTMTNAWVPDIGGDIAISRVGDTGPDAFCATEADDGQPIDLSTYFASVSIVYKAEDREVIEKATAFQNGIPHGGTTPVPGIVFPFPGATEPAKLTAYVKCVTPTGRIETLPVTKEWKIVE